MQERQHGYDKADHEQPATQIEDVAPNRHSSAMAAPEHPVASGLLMRKGEGATAGHAEAAVAGATSSIGSSLPAPLMRKFESSIGADLSNVRVHTGSESATAASSVGARAYATGQDIHFGAGQYDPSSSGGQHLIAHEVAHTVQQRGGAPSRQNKLEVSSPHDAAEHEADHAADAMVAGAPATVSSGGLAISRKPVDPSTGDLQGAGDEAQQKAWATPLQVDTLSVQTDRDRVGEVIADINAQQKNVDAAVKADSNIEAQYGPQAKNTETKTRLSIFNTKLDVTNVDTAAFGSQYRYAYADYQRLVAEANEYLTAQNRNGARTNGDPLGVVAAEHDDGVSSAVKIDSNSQSVRFMAARRNLNTAATKMNSQMTLVRGAANSLQGAIFKASQAAAAAAGAAAAGKLAAVNAEIAQVAAGVSTVVKIASAVGGLAGGTGATSAIGTAKASSEAGGTHIGVSDFAAQTGMKGQDVLTPEAHSKAALAAAMGKDAASVFSSGGDPATALVTAIGTYANKDKIGTLQAAITKAAAEEATFKVAGDALLMTGYQQTLEGQAGSLMVLQQAFVSAKQEVQAAGEDLMAVLNKGGAKGKKQARSVLFLTDADRFLAQVETAISSGKNQQSNLKGAAEDRRGLRGTSAALGEKGVGPNGEEAANQYYYRCSKIETKGVIYGTNTQFKLDRVFVKFQDNGTIHQGGKGTIEGAGSADDEVAVKIKTLEMAKKQVQALQSQVQSALGLGAPGLNA